MPRIFHDFVSAVPEGTDLTKVRTSHWNEEHVIVNPTDVNPEDFNFDPITPGGTLNAGIPNIVTLPVVPRGVYGGGVPGFPIIQYLYISGGTGTAEAVLITGGNAVPGATNGTISFTPTYAHSGNWTIRSATAGAQEALREAESNNLDAMLLRFKRGTTVTYAPIRVSINNTKIFGSGSSTIQNEVGLVFNVGAANVEIAHLRFWQARIEACVGIESTGHECYFYNLKFDYGGGAIKVSGGFWTVCRDIHARNLSHFGIEFSDGVGHNIDGFFLAADGDGTNGVQRAGVIIGTEGCRVTRLDILFAKIGLLIEASARYVNWVDISFSYLDNSIDQGIVIRNNSAHVLQGIYFTRVWSATAGHQPNSVQGNGIGIYVDGTGVITNLEFSLCWIHNNQDENVKIFSGSDMRFIDCRFMGGNTDADPGVDNIYIGTSGTIFFKDCRFGSIPSVGIWTEQYRSHILAGPTSNTVFVQDCDFSTNGVSWETGAQIGNFSTVPENVRIFGFNKGLSDITANVTAAATTTLPVSEVINIVNTDPITINRIQHGWPGRKIVLRASAGTVTLAPLAGVDGNIVDGLTLLAGQVTFYRYEFDRWWNVK